MANQQDQEEIQPLSQANLQYLEEEQLQDVTGGGLLSCLSCLKPKVKEDPPRPEGQLPTIHFVEAGQGMTVEQVRDSLSRNMSVHVELGTASAMQAAVGTRRISLNDVPLSLRSAIK